VRTLIPRRVGIRTKKDAVNAALRKVLARRRRALALTKLREATSDGAFDLALLADKKNYRRVTGQPTRWYGPS
jgi:Arc/MetJ family transcription regulator